MQAARTLSLAALDGVTLYEPGELTLVAQAGMSLKALGDLLDSENQQLTFEPADHRALLEGPDAARIDRRVVARMMPGRTMSAQSLLTIQRARVRLRGELVRLLNGRTMLMPTTPNVAPEIAPLEADNPVTRSNDGRADPWGGFWIGTMGFNAEPQAGAIYRYYKGEVLPIVRNITISNAICFAPDRSCAYYTDTPTRQIMPMPWWLASMTAAASVFMSADQVNDLTYVVTTKDGETTTVGSE